MVGAVFLMAAPGCGDDGDSSDETSIAELDDPCRVSCDDTLTPVVFVHGMLASSDTWAAHARRFECNGYCPSHLRGLDWNTLAADGRVETLQAFIQQVLDDTGAAAVDLVGHSAGGGLGYSYLSDPARAQTVRRYAHVASTVSSEGQPLGPAGPVDASVPTLNLWSDGDLVVAGAVNPGTTDVMIAGQDHYEIATSRGSFEAIYRHFRDAEPSTSEVLPASRVEWSGSAVTLGENAPLQGWTVDAYLVAEDTGMRTSAAPLATFEVGAEGRWGPLELRQGDRVELSLTGPDADDLPVHYYFEPAMFSSDMRTLRALPGPGTLAGLLLGQIPFEDSHANIVAFASRQAIIAGRDTLDLDGQALAVEETAAAERTTIAVFIFDEDVDGLSSGPSALFSSTLPVFLTAIDQFLPADPSTHSLLTFNGRTLALPRWPSGSAGPAIAVFD